MHTESSDQFLIYKCLQLLLKPHP